jgi:glycosyltransferase involved in cell wall biosynthesis
VPESRIATIANGVDCDAMFAPTTADRATARARFGLPSDCVVLAFVGRLSEEKRPLAFLQLVMRLAAHADVRALMIGIGPLAPTIEARLDDLDLRTRVRRVEELPRDQMPAVFAAADLLVMTSAVEGLPLAVLEALAVGCPVAATSAGDMASVIRHGETGFLAPVQGPEALLPDILAYIQDPARQRAMRDAARASIVGSIYTKSAMLKGYQGLLSQARAQPS